MLKITYSDSDVVVEQLAIAVDVMVAQRSIVALRAGQSLVMQPSYGSFTVPTGLPGIDQLTCHSQGCSQVEVALCDADWVEITLRGTWLADHPASDVGILVAELGNALEQQVADLWQHSLECSLADCPQLS